MRLNSIRFVVSLSLLAAVGCSDQIVFVPLPDALDVQAPDTPLAVDAAEDATATADAADTSPAADVAAADLASEDAQADAAAADGAAADVGADAAQDDLAAADGAGADAEDAPPSEDAVAADTGADAGADAAADAAQEVATADAVPEDAAQVDAAPADVLDAGAPADAASTDTVQADAAPSDSASDAGADAVGPCSSGLPCADNDPCTLDLCWGLSCQHFPIVACKGPLVPCDAGHACAAGNGVCDLSRDACVPCVVAADCGTGFACSQNACVPALPCKSDLACKDAGQVCDKAAGVCADCVSGGDCAKGEQCVAGSCQAAIACTSSKECPAVCEPKSGLCVACLDAADCGDGLACNTLHQCVPATCKATTCVDGSAFACKAGGWSYAAALDCTDGNPCTTDACTGGIGCTNVVNAVPCDDGNACTLGDVCAAGSCAGTAADCNDNQVCTTDSCNTTKGCVNAVQSGPCDDGSACTAADQCVGSACVGAALSCDDKQFCTTDACDPKAGCTHLPLATTPCDDGDACTVATQCTEGLCQGGKALNCDDGHDCTADACHADKGCSHAPLDGTACSDGSACTAKDTCKAGTCVSIAVVCTDGQLCTTDGCDPASGCTFTANQEPCEDGNPCSAPDVCTGGTCQSGTLIDCDDKNPCTDDSCDGKGGCNHKVLSDKTVCDDGDACTLLDACLGGACKGAGIDCTDSNPCTADACSGGNCQHVAILGPCDDKDGCTVGDTCSGGNCTPGKPVDCGTDSKGCGSGVCVSTGSQTFKCSTTTQPDGTPCDADGNGCTVGDQCKAGACVSGAAKDCSALTAAGGCKIGTCQSLSPSTANCVAVPAAVLTPCNADNNGCTSGDACDAMGTCASGVAVECATDAASCTTGTCKSTGPGSYVCTGGKAKADGTACNADGSGCTLDTCAAGQCVAGGVPDCTAVADKCHTGACKSSAWNAYTCMAAAVDCQDGNPCTNDSCALPGGCVFVANSAGCSDNDVCTLGDVCSDGKCLGGTAAVCDDLDACTVDGCDAASGCTTKPLGCDDSDPCTSDSCDAKSGCAHQPLADCIIVGLPYFEPFDCGGAKGWTLGQTAEPGVGWAVDGTAAAPGYLSPACSLNFNNGVDYPCTNPMDAVATSPVFAADQLPIGTHLALRLFNNGAYEGKAYDKMSVEITTNSGLGWTEVLVIPAPTTLSWVLQTLDLTPYVGQAFQLRLRFQTTDCLLNETVGGFVDDLAIYTTSCGANLGTCDDKNPCTSDTCDKMTGQCSFVANALGCSDGNACTQGDACKAGVCVGTAPTCDDANVCTLDSCDPGSGKCLHVAVDTGLTCNDSNPCTTNDACAAGTCVGGPSPCNDGNSCTVDICTNLAGAASCSTKPLPDKTACDDGNSCTGPDTCTAGSCGGADLCGYVTAFGDTFSCNAVSKWALQSVGKGPLGWAIDATPAAPGFYSASCSLNFNDGQTYGSVVPAVASATSPSFALASKASACKLSLYSWGGVSPWNNEVRAVALVDAASGQDLVTYSIPYGTDNGVWTAIGVDCLAALGHTVSVQLRFSDMASIFPVQPTGAGWFVDDVLVTLGTP